MAADPTVSPGTALLDVVEDAHAQALSSLCHGALMDAVVWLSAHVAAVNRVIAPKARADRAATREHKTSVRRLEGALRIAERMLSGDALAASLDREAVRR